MLKAGKMVEKYCEAVDINLGCPQGIARKGHYGAYLMDDFKRIENIVETLHLNLTIPVCCKIRIFPDINKTLELAQLIEKSGCSLLTVHGRTKEQNKERVGECNWNVIKKIKETLKIPVFANGGIECYNDIDRCIKETGVDGVMLGEAILEDPSICNNGCDKDGKLVTQDELYLKYIDYAVKYGANPTELRGHGFKILHSGLKVFYLCIYIYIDTH